MANKQIIHIEKYPKLSSENSRYLTNRLLELRTIIDLYKMIDANSETLNDTDGCDFIGLTKLAFKQKIYIDFIAIISGNDLPKFLKSHPALQSILNQLNQIKAPFKYARDKYLAHMDFNFDHQEVPEVDLKAVEESFNQIFTVIEQISENPILNFPGRASNSACHSLQAIIDLVKQDKQATLS